MTGLEKDDLLAQSLRSAAWPRACCATQLDKHLATLIPILDASDDASDTPRRLQGIVATLV